VLIQLLYSSHLYSSPTGDSYESSYIAECRLFATVARKSVTLSTLLTVTTYIHDHTT